MESQKIAVVTGGAGFIGSHLCDRLVQEGYKVISLDNYFTGSPANHVIGVEYRTGHTKDISKHITETPTLVFHLGEYARTEKSFEDIELVWDLNKTGTFAVLEFCRRNNSKLIYAGSSTKFADDGDGRNQSPYAWTKATNTELVKNYSEWFGLNYAITYFYNVYGPREMSGAFGTLIKIFTELYKNGQPLTITAPGTQTRNYTNVFDIVEGIILTGKYGNGDGYGIGADQEYSVLDVAKMFTDNIIMMPERKGNRMTSCVDNQKVKSLGWEQKHFLPDWIKAIKAEAGEVKASELKVLVFSTTFYPQAGPAELAVLDLAQSMPEVNFDIITTKFSQANKTEAVTPANVNIYRVGYGNKFDKWLLPLLGSSLARKLKRENSYMFQWSLFASYAALAALLSSTKIKVPLLITLADQKLGLIPWYTRFVLRHLLAKADQVYAMDTYEAKSAVALSKRTTLVHSIGNGDAFANQVRFAYASFLSSRFKK